MAKTSKKPKTAPNPEQESAPEQERPADDGVPNRKKVSPVDKQIRQLTGSVIGAVMQAEKVRSGDTGIVGAAEAFKLIIGLPIPFALEYLLGCSVLPLGRVYLVNGKPGGSKSAFGFEFARIFRSSLAMVNGQQVAYGGGGNLFEHESKYSPSLAQSIIDWNYADGDQIMAVYPCDSVDDWQAKLWRVTEGIYKVATGKPMPGARRVKKKKGKEAPEPVLKGKPPGLVFPWVNIVDSVMGKLSDESQANIEDKGSAGRKHPDEAMSITYYLKSFPGRLLRLPAILVLINHVKDKIKEAGTPSYGKERAKGGGIHQDYQATFELELTRLGKTEKRDNPLSGGSLYTHTNKLLISCYKNSMGTTFRQIKVNLNWDTRPTAQGQCQYTRFDWASATVDLLLGLREDGTATTKERLSAVLDIGKLQGGRFYSKALGISKDKPVGKSALGRAIEANKEIRNKLRDLLDIHRYRLFVPGVDYRKQLAQLSKKLEQDVERAETAAK